MYINCQNQTFRPFWAILYALLNNVPKSSPKTGPKSGLNTRPKCGPSRLNFHPVHWTGCECEWRGGRECKRCHFLCVQIARVAGGHSVVRKEGGLVWCNFVYFPYRYFYGRRNGASPEKGISSLSAKTKIRSNGFRNAVKTPKTIVEKVFGRCPGLAV